MSGYDNGENGLLIRQKINSVLDAAEMIASPAALVADTAFTYTTGQARTVAAGSVISSVDGDHKYEVQASDASTYDLQTAGGVKLNLLPVDDGVYVFSGMNPTKDGTGDNLGLLQKLLDKTLAISDGARIGPTILFSYGQFAFSAAINLKSIVRLIGVANGFGLARATNFIFPDNTAGIIVNRHNTLDDQTVTSTYGADGSHIIGINLIGGRGSAFDETKSGIWLRARALIKDCSAYSFPGHALYAGAGSDGNPYLGNCNLFRVETFYGELCRGSAFHAEGTDANAGNVFFLNGKNNDLWCVYEDSFLQNTHMGHHSLDNDAGSYYSSNQSTLIGCYAEDGNGDNAEWAGTMIGCMITDFAASVGPKLMTEQANGPRALRNDTGGFRGGRSTHSTDIASEENAVLSSRHSITGISYPFRVNWETDATGIYIRWASSSTRLMNFNGSSTANTYGRSSAVGESLNIPGFFLGLNANARYRGTGTAAPTTGTWARGDIIENINISSGSPMCWGCSVAGTPGTWIPGPNWP